MTTEPLTSVPPQVEHNCVRELRLLVRDQGETICKVQQDMTDMR